MLRRMNCQPINILLVEEDRVFAELAACAFKSNPGKFALTTVACLAEAKESLTQNSPDLAIADIILADGRGTDLIAISQEHGGFPVVLITGYGDTQEAVAAIRAGAIDCIVKSKEALDNLPQIVERALRQRQHITERKRAEEALQESETRYRELFDNMSSGVAVYKPVENGSNFVFKNLNRAGEKINKVKLKDVVGKKVTEAFPGVEEFGLLDVFQRVYKTGKPEHHPVTMYKDNRYYAWYDNYVYKLPSGEIVAVYDDVTDRKQAEQALREAKIGLDLALGASNIGPWDWDLQTNDMHFSPEWKKQIGYADNEVPNRYEEWESRLHPEDRDNVLTVLKEYLDGDRKEYVVEFRLRHKDDSYRWIFTRAEVLRNADGKPTHMLGCHIDITEHKKAEEDAYRIQLELAVFTERLKFLKERERQVMYMIAEGNLNKQIAFKLGLSRRTVETYRARIMKKLQIDSLAELVRYLTKIESQQ